MAIAFLNQTKVTIKNEKSSWFNKSGIVVHFSNHTMLGMYQVVFNNGTWAYFDERELCIWLPIHGTRINNGGNQ